MSIQQPPAWSIGDPVLPRSARHHWQHAGVAAALLGDPQESVRSAWGLNPAAGIFDANEKELVAESEGKMLEEGGIGVRSPPEPDAAIDLAIEMRPRSLPAREERFGHVLHIDRLHKHGHRGWAVSAGNAAM